MNALSREVPIEPTYAAAIRPQAEETRHSFELWSIAGGAAETAVIGRKGGTQRKFTYGRIQIRLAAIERRVARGLAGNRVENALRRPGGRRARKPDAMEPGGVYPSTTIQNLRNCFTLEGVVNVGRQDHRPGDYAIAHAGSRHEIIRSASGGLILLHRNALAAPA